MFATVKKFHWVSNYIQLLSTHTNTHLSLLHLIWKIKKPKKKKEWFKRKRKWFKKTSCHPWHGRLTSGRNDFPDSVNHAIVWAGKGQKWALFHRKFISIIKFRQKLHEQSASQTIIQPVKCHVALCFSISQWYCPETKLKNSPSSWLHSVRKCVFYIRFAHQFASQWHEIFAFCWRGNTSYL